jgi:hypothetical protein
VDTASCFGYDDEDDGQVPQFACRDEESDEEEEEIERIQENYHRQQREDDDGSSAPHYHRQQREGDDGSSAPHYHRQQRAKTINGKDIVFLGCLGVVGVVAAVLLPPYLLPIIVITSVTLLYDHFDLS